ncbi:hypothetical protein MMC32_002767 [Xylographa parallela]|nr:hypothetical protein [Xylographa parallela]
MSTSAAFQKAASNVTKFEVEPPGEDRLKGKYKYNAWKEMADKGVTSAQAQQQYVKFVDELRPKYEKK